MKLNINLAEDAELRAYIKDLIKGQVASLLRSDLYKIVQETFKVETSVKLTKNMDSIIKEEIKKQVILVLGTASYLSENFIQKETKKLIKERLDEFLNNKYSDKIK